MVNIKDTSVEKLHEKLKNGKTKKLINSVFGENIYVSDLSEVILFTENQSIFQKIFFYL